MPLIFAVLVALSLIGIFFSYLVQYAERWMMPWQYK
jgi:NitT/TauT family transport system permease protein